GESSSAYRHKAAALRFIMQRSGGYMVVDGNKNTFEDNDFLISPNSTWHMHGVAEDGKMCICQDALDIPLVNALEDNDYAVFDENQPLERPVNYSPMTYGGTGLMPSYENWDKPYSPLFKYEWKKVYPALLDAAQAGEGSPYD